MFREGQAETIEGVITKARNKNGKPNWSHFYVYLDLQTGFYFPNVLQEEIGHCEVKAYVVSGKLRKVYQD